MFAVAGRLYKIHLEPVVRILQGTDISWGNNVGRLLIIAAISLMATVQAPAAAQVTELRGTYKEGNIVRVTSRVKMPAPPASAYRVAMLKAATMAGQKGFTRLAVVKVDDCVSLGINNGPAIVQTCKVFGQMLSKGEVAKPLGKDHVRYLVLKRQTMESLSPC